MLDKRWVELVTGSHEDLDAIFAELPPILSAGEVAELLRMTTPGVYKWLREGVIKGYQIGKTWFVPADALRAVLEAGVNQHADSESDGKE